MATSLPAPGPVGPDTWISIKISIDGQNRRFKLALRDLGPHILPQKLRFLLQIPAGIQVKFDRFSDSAGAFVTLDSNNPTVYKQLYRAAKAKLKLRLNATIIKDQIKDQIKADPFVVDEKVVPEASKRNTYLETVLSQAPADRQLPLVPTEVKSTVVEQLMDHTTQPALSRPTLPSMNDFRGTAFSIDCNSCGESVSNEHYHCGKCEKGDFDLCPNCIASGITCDGEDHWLIKRTIKNDKVYASNTETLPPKTKLPPVQSSQPEPVVEEDQRTCNSCIIQLGASSFVTCQQCADYDLCFFCLEHGEHGHHPAHTFAPVESTSAAVTPYIKTLCKQGRGLKHEAVCDGCDAQIFGVRHKCLTCPDFDYCSTCVPVATEVHPGHRFAPIYEQLGMITVRKEQHRGIYCDGPICTARAKKTYIRGDRFKCAVCHDTDFCANCEALPTNPHNKTHPLIKLRTPVRHLLIATTNELENGASPVVLGDRCARHMATETVRSPSVNAATQVHTVAETAPVDHVKHEVVANVSAASHVDLKAYFESDSTPDGSSFAPNRLISQSWTLRNPGPHAWPAGCAVHFIGGDEMRNLDNKHPSSIVAMTNANQSNILDHGLESGKTATFSVMLKSPTREGRAISYWRMKTAEGIPFGHKLWCDITVTKAAITPVEVPAVVPVEAPVESKEVPAEMTEQSPESSQMIFPTLEKESPESSINDIKREVVLAEPSVTSEDQDLLDDLESMALEDDSTEDGFMTDEEYDILDAEDEEYLASAQLAARK